MNLTMPQFQHYCNWYFYKKIETDYIVCAHRDSKREKPYIELEVDTREIDYWIDCYDEFLARFEVDGYQMSQKDKERAYRGLQFVKSVIA